jgi:hypothetical protein
MSQYCNSCGSENLNEATFCSKCGTKLLKQTGGEDNSSIEKESDELGFGWWTTWAWLGLTIGNIMIFTNLESNEGLALFLAGIQTLLMILILRYNKYAFLIATVLSINPILWVINGIYLKNRWCNPKVNNGKAC